MRSKEGILATESTLFGTVGFEVTEGASLGVVTRRRTGDAVGSEVAEAIVGPVGIAVDGVEGVVAEAVTTASSWLGSAATVGPSDARPTLRPECVC